MAGVWKKTLQYLGLVEDDELEELEDADASATQSEPTSVRRITRTEMPVAERPEAIVRTMPSTRRPTAAIHRAEPRRFNEAREIFRRMGATGKVDAIDRILAKMESGRVSAASSAATASSRSRPPGESSPTTPPM